MVVEIRDQAWFEARHEPNMNWAARVVDADVRADSVSRSRPTSHPRNERVAIYFHGYH